MTATLRAVPASAATLAPYGTLVEPAADGTAAGGALLDLGRGTPRFYIMRLPRRAMVVDRVTRHRRVTQCLAALGGARWLLVLAPPGDPDDDAATPDCNRLAAFVFAGGQGVILHRGTWHHGPLFDADTVEFVNLELTDTNEVDHATAMLDREYAVRA